MKRRGMIRLIYVTVIVLMLAGCNKINSGKITPTQTGEQNVSATPTAQSGEQNVSATPAAQSGEQNVTATPTVQPTSQPPVNIALADRELYHYDMDLTLNNENKTVSGHVIFDFYNDSADAWDKLCFRDYPSLFTLPENVGLEKGIELFGALTEIKNIIDRRDNAVLACERDDDASVIWIKPEKPLLPNEKMTLEYDFVTTIPQIGDRFGTAAGLYNLANFYPILAEYADGEWSHTAYISVGECFYSEISNYDVSLTVPKDYAVISTGTEVGKKDNGDTKTITFEAPCVRDFVFSASAFYSVDTQVFDDITVNVMYENRNDEGLFPEDNQRPDFSVCARFAMKAAEEALAAFGNAFGKYPYKELDVIICPLMAGGMEYPNLIQVTDSYYRQFENIYYEGNPMKQMLINEFKICVAHEIGHQWFMGIVGSNSGMQPWLDESFASYTELVYADYLKTEKNISSMDSLSSLTKSSGDFSNPEVAKTLIMEGTLPIDLPYYDYRNDDSYIIAVYGNGQRVLRQMEEILGRDEFYAVIREYVKLHAFTNAKTEDFFDVLYKHAGTDNEALNALITNCFSSFYLPE